MIHHENSHFISFRTMRRSMSGASAMDSFVRGFYPDYDKDALIIDVRNNRGGNIDSVSNNTECHY